MTITASIDKRAKQVSGSVVIDAKPEEIFELLVDPAMHGTFDGSGMVGDQIAGPDRLAMGSKFGMKMQLGPLPYRISNTVVEFDEPSLIAWRHVGRHRWRYELETVEGGTKVTETFDWSTAVVPAAIEAVGYPARHKVSIEETLKRLADVVADRTE